MISHQQIHIIRATDHDDLQFLVNTWLDERNEFIYATDYPKPVSYDNITFQVVEVQKDVSDHDPVYRPQTVHYAFIQYTV